MIKDNALNKRKWNRALANKIWNSTIIKDTIPYITDKIVIDVGGNSGYHSGFYSKYASKVITYEPVPQLFEILQKNLKQFGDNFELYNKAVGNLDGEIELFVDINRLSMTSQIPLVESTKIKVPMIKLDSEHLDIPISYIKIDVEGFEYSVLEGAKELINKYHPVCLVEMYLPWFQKTKESPSLIFNWFISKNYKCYCWNNSTLTEVSNYDELLDQLSNKHPQHDGDFLFIWQ